jgi:hypothetical protein
MADFWTVIAWSGLIGFLLYNWLLQQQTQQNQRQQQLQRVQEAAASARAAPVQTGRKGKGKRGKSDAPKGMTGGLEARGDSAGPSSSAQEHLPDEVGA